MKTINNMLKSLGAVAVIIGANLIMSSCKDDFTSPAAPAGNTIVQVAGTSDSLKAFAYALGKAGLSSNFDNLNGGQFTAFAPSNYAFVKYLRAVGLIKIGKTDVGGSHAYDSAKKAIDRIKFTTNSASPKISLTGANSTISFASVLDYHFVTSGILSSSFTGNQAFTTLNNGRLSLSKVTGGTYTYLLNANITGSSGGPGANIVTVDIGASNGVLHMIDQVMVPVSTANIWNFSLLNFNVNYSATPYVALIGISSSASVVMPLDTADHTGKTYVVSSAFIDSDTTNYNLFTAALVRSGMASTIIPNGAAISPDFTVFAPTDGAFLKYLSTISGTTISTETAARTYINNSMTGSTLATLIKYHTVAGRVLTSDITDSQTVNTLLSNASFTVKLNGSTYYLSDANVSSQDAKVSSPNKLTNVGVVHSIQRVLQSQ